MEYRLQTWNECINNANEFAPYRLRYNPVNGLYRINYDHGTLACYRFVWITDGSLHRIDGPAEISFDESRWLFMGRQIPVKSQTEFEEWLIKNISI